MLDWVQSICSIYLPPMYVPVATFSKPTATGASTFGSWPSYFMLFGV